MCRPCLLVRVLLSCVLTVACGCWLFLTNALAREERDREPAKATLIPRAKARDLGPQAANVEKAVDAFDSRFIHREYFAALIVHPSAVLKSPSLRLMPVEVLEKLAFGSLPIEFSQLREVVFLFGIDASFEFFGGAICRFEQPYDRAKLATSLDTPPAAGAPVLYRLRGAEERGLAFADDRTILIAPLRKLPAMLASQAGASPLVERLQRADLGCAAEFVAVTWPANVETPLMEEPELARILTLCTAVEVRLDLDEEPRMTVVLDCQNAKDVAELNRLLDAAVDGCAQLFDAAPLKPGEASGPPFDSAAPLEASMRYFKRLIERLASDFECQERDEQLVLKIKGELLASAAFGTMASEYLFEVADFLAFMASETAGQDQSDENLQKIGEAVLAYHELHEKLPRTSVDRDGKPLLSWRVDLLPFLGEGELYKQFHRDEPWDSEHNLKLADRMPDVFRSDVEDRSPKTCYLAVVGPQAVFSPGKEVALEQLGDLSQTLLFVEANASRAMVWTKPDDFIFDSADPLAGLGGRRPGGFMALYADGFMHFVSFSLAPDELQSLFRPKMSKPAEKPEEEE